MRKIIFLILCITFSSSVLALSINGKLNTSDCKTEKAMMWLSLDKDNYKERKLLTHTMVPMGGTFSFYVRPGTYQLRGSDEKGCEFFTKVSISEKDQTFQVALKEGK